MPGTQESTHDDRELTRYLLGQLADEDADRLDELTIVDDDVAWRVRTVENDLVDAYVRGALDAESRQFFETHYLASPKRRAKVRFAARLARAVDALGPPATRPERRRGAFAIAPDAERTREQTRDARGPHVHEGRWLNWLVPQSAAGWAALYAAATLLAIACGLLVMRDLRLGSALHESEQQRAALDRRARELEDQLAGRRAAAAATEGQAAVDRTPAFTQDATRPSSPSPSPSSPPGSSVGTSSRSGGSPAAVALVLWPQTRGVTGSGGASGTGAAAPAVAMSRGVDRLMLELQLEEPDFASYSAALKEAATGLIVWRGDRITSPAPGAPPVVTIAVPANLLKPRAYALELTGYGTAGGSDVIGSYAFQVVRR